MRRKATYIIMCALAAVALTSCNEKELCFDHWDHASRYAVDFRAQWKLDWESRYLDGPDWQQNWPATEFGIAYDALRPVTPEGLRAQVYTDGHDNELSNIAATGGIVNMTPGLHQILLYNNDTEYILFNDITSLAEASATTRTRSRATYLGNSKLESEISETTVNAPDFLFGHYIPEYTAVKSPTAPTVDVTLKPLVFRYLIRYRFKHGLEYVGLGRGALAGMAGSVYLTDGHTGKEAVTVLYDCEVKEDCVEAIVNTFGIPNFPNPDYSRADRAYGLNLEVRLKNGRMLSFDFDITDQIARQPRGGVIEVDGIDIPDEIGKDDSGAFDVTVEGWGEYQDISIDFGKK